ncbi:MAG: ABC transporter permease, partial [Planctomycetes bacterium]|nr:ABC transporter permease [Planctomycetota bacterium]
MNSSIQTIPLMHLAITLIPVVIVVGILVKWSLNAGNVVYALIRMLVQLSLIGYLLAYIFESDSAWIVLAVLAVMVLSSSWIALGTVKKLRLKLFKYALLSILLCGGLT